MPIIARDVSGTHVPPKSAESTHWYDKEGNPMYQVKKKTGTGYRDTTIRDARELGLLPSVTTIMKIMASPGLERYKLSEMFKASQNLSRAMGESEEDYTARVYKESVRHAYEAADEGSRIHEAIESYFTTGEYNQKYRAHVLGTLQCLPPSGGSWIAEESFASPHGYAGKVDLYNEDWVIDFKTKDMDELKPISKLKYPEHAIQLAAYGEGLRLHRPKYRSIYISRTQPGIVKYYDWEDGDWLDRFHLMFRLWKMTNHYTPDYYNRVVA